MRRSYTFWTYWKEVTADGDQQRPLDYATQHTFNDEDTARKAHKASQEMHWVTNITIDPGVSDLYENYDGHKRVIQAAK